jgi:hypothetical protein
METFLLGVRDQLVHVEIQDERGSTGAVLTLADVASGTRLLPVRSPIPPAGSDERKTTGGKKIPTLPIGLVDDQLGHLGRLMLDTSDLPSGNLAFAIEPFVKEAMRHVHESQASVRLTLADAETWGLIDR